MAVLSAVAALRWSQPSPVVSPESQAVSAQAGQAGPIMLTEATEQTGLDFWHTVAQPNGYYFPDIMSSGVAFFDYDQDGRHDIYHVNGSRQFPHSPIAPQSDDSKPATNRLYRQTEDGTFVDMTEQSGLGDVGYGSGVAIGDVNNDGYPDVYITNVGRDRLFLNQGDGTFVDITESAGIDNPRWGASVGFFDFDRDGWLDIYVTNYVDYHASRRCENRHGRPDYCHPGQFDATVDKLYRNTTGSSAVDADGRRSVRFEDVSLSSGIASQSGPGLGVIFADFDDDGWPDIYVANDSTPNFLWINQRDGTFRDEAVLWSVATDGQGYPESSMGIAYGDIDGDGRSDILLTHLNGETHTLYLRQSSFGFADRTAATGFLTSSFHSTGFGVVFCDFQNNGYLDAVIANGHVKRPETSADLAEANERQATVAPQDRTPFGRVYAERNHVFLNDGTGKLHAAADDTCPFRRPAEISRGLACGDINGNGALDLVVTNAGGPARLYFNETPNRGNWLMVRAVEPALGGRDAYGAVVTVLTADRSWQRVINSAYSYLSANDPRAHFGLGDVEQIDRIEVRWPDGSRESFTGGPVNRVVVLAHGEGI